MLFPNRAIVIGLLKNLRPVLFPQHFGVEKLSRDHLQEKMKAQIVIALKDEGRSSEAPEITQRFFSQLDEIREKLYLDAKAGFDGDPSAYSIDEVILSYPGFFAIYVHRLVHILYKENVPYIPRVMSEYAHSKTGIDIHPGAEIGDYFFIDHGTGVVIGETTVIGTGVKLYQGVTLGALSTKGGQRLKNVRRHPIIEDNVTIYAGATILGGDTHIGENSVIGGNTFITESVPSDSRVLMAKCPEN